MADRCIGHLHEGALILEVPDKVNAIYSMIDVNLENEWAKAIERLRLDVWT